MGKMQILAPGRRKEVYFRDRNNREKRFHARYSNSFRRNVPEVDARPDIDPDRRYGPPDAERVNAPRNIPTPRNTPNLAVRNTPVSSTRNTPIMSPLMLDDFDDDFQSSPSRLINGPGEATTTSRSPRPGEYGYVWQYSPSTVNRPSVISTPRAESGISGSVLRRTRRRSSSSSSTALSNRRNAATSRRSTAARRGVRRSERIRIRAGGTPRANPHRRLTESQQAVMDWLTNR